MLTVTAAHSDPGRAAGEAEDVELSFLVTDIEGSSKLTEELGDQPWVELLLIHNAIVRDRMWRHGGREVKSRGDGFLVAFERPIDAARCAISIQRALADYEDRHPGAALRVRIGLHHGPALSVPGDVVGLTVTIAERIGGAATGGEVLATTAFRALVDSDGIRFDPEREVCLTGLCTAQRVAPLRWRRPDAAP